MVVLLQDWVRVDFQAFSALHCLAERVLLCIDQQYQHKVDYVHSKDDLKAPVQSEELQSSIESYYPFAKEISDFKKEYDLKTKERDLICKEKDVSSRVIERIANINLRKPIMPLNDLFTHDADLTLLEKLRLFSSVKEGVHEVVRRGRTQEPRITTYIIIWLTLCDIYPLLISMDTYKRFQFLLDLKQRRDRSTINEQRFAHFKDDFKNFEIEDKSLMRVFEILSSAQKCTNYF
ncbi:hypothetical protein ACOME3_001963 [Neoechinorhynchus agilis]